MTHLERAVCDQETSLGLGIHSFDPFTLKKENNLIGRHSFIAYAKKF